MIDFAPGMRVMVRDEEWMIKKVETNDMKHHALYCIGVTPLVRECESVFLDDIDHPIPVDPKKVNLIVDESPHYRDSLLYLESQWRQRIPTDTQIHVGQKAAMNLMPFQLKPTQVALSQPRQRILIADAVGLGKTLEAGILMSELILRGKGKRILVVTGKSMMVQFQKEMWNRFTIPLVRLDSNKIRQIRSQLPVNDNPFFYYDKTIISIDTLKNDVAYRNHLEHAHWDIIVIDEAQNVATRGSKKAQRAKLAEVLSKQSDTMIMLSATPHDGRPESFASLMNMLDPTAIANPSDYTKEDIQGLFVRRFKKDVIHQMQGTAGERRMLEERCPSTEAEEYAYDLLTHMHLDMDLRHKKGTGQLFQTSLEKALFSSPAACVSTVENRLKRLRKRYADDEIDDIHTLQQFRDAVAEITPKKFSRYQRLLSLLQSEDYAWNRKAKDDRIVIFTERVDTMHFLYAQLKKDMNLKKAEIAQISGSMSDEEQQKIVEDFGRLEAKVRILVASDVASEGLNLHYLSHRLIHFDLPWSLMVFQQRNGRIDRYGQKKQPDIRYLVTEAQNPKIRGDLRLLEILVEKEEQAQKNIGDPAQLLADYSIDGEQEHVAGLMEKDYSPEEIQAELEQHIADDPLAFLLGQADAEQEEKEDEPVTVEDHTLFSDTDYLYEAMTYFNRTEEHPVERLTRTKGLDIQIDDTIRRRMRNKLPREVYEQLKDKSYLRLVSDKQFCMDAVVESQEGQSENAWPDVQYLWPLNPIFDWVNDKTSLIYERDQAPLAVLPEWDADTCVYVLSGSIPNRKSTPLVDAWFGLLYEKGQFVRILPLSEVIRKAGLHGKLDLPNMVDRQSHYHDLQEHCQSYLSDVIDRARDYLHQRYEAYEKQAHPQIDAEVDKLIALQEKHIAYQRRTLERQGKRRQDAGVREVETIFGEFVNWVQDTMVIQDNPYIRVLAVFTGKPEGGHKEWQ